MSNDTAPQLFQAREPVFPQRVSGRFRRLKWSLLAITLGIYYATPWIRWDRGPNLPDQAVLIDLAHARFFFFWIEIWPHEFYFIAGLLIMAGLGLFLFTSALGRVWCGYACPQTVWTDLFLLIERWIEGDRNARIKLLRAKLSPRKIRLRLSKWAAWLVISVATGGAWVFYFADAPTLMHHLFTGQAALVAYGTIACLTATTFVFGGFLREQVCTYMCPWPRIQAAMMDEHSLTVAYRNWRGEPRGKMGKAEGDCIDCMACVNVCPQGIDIRDGQQVECITCALCIDACDAMMDKIGRPRGLIDYCALTDEPQERAGQAPKPLWAHVMRLRNFIYFGLWAGIGVGLVVALFVRSDFSVSITPDRNPRFVRLSDGGVRNAYDLKISNQTGDNRRFHISIKTDEALRVKLQGTDEMNITVPADQSLHQRVYIFAKPVYLASRTDSTPVRFWIEDINSGERQHVDSIFAGETK
ncbi:protein RdxB [Amylibacter marinus]|uniref:Protein RdxB n=1 Tax=Amylibacter marinus TaxID=1475483 RepID=A0ABQ5VYK6_9RHOB|nr:cytochrome c oxidase accessory protein CcoG [Amylibacter marinus]GLQ36287.1 protein RdxB [Amylibacter marinus]